MAQRAILFLRRAGTVILAVSVVLWALASYPRANSMPSGGPPDRITQEQQLERSALGHVGHIIEPIVRPLGFDWKIGVGIAASFVAREVFVSTMGTIYGVGHTESGAVALGDRLRAERDPGSERPVYTILVAITLMLFYVFAQMCASTMAVTVRETGGGRRGWGWAGFQFGYLFVLAYTMAFVVYHGGRMLGFGA